MSIEFDLYVVVHNLHSHLCEWAAKYVSAASACRVASIGSGRLFQMATILWDCEDGPYAEALNSSVPILISVGNSEGVTQFGAIESHPVIPDDEFLDALANWYSIVYMAAQLGEWTFTEREEVSRLIRMNHPPTVDEHAVTGWLQRDGLGILPLRRAVDALERHRCGTDLVCHAAEEAQLLHEKAGLEWARTARRLEALNS